MSKLVVGKAQRGGPEQIWDYTLPMSVICRRRYPPMVEGDEFGVRLVLSLEPVPKKGRRS